MNLISRILLNFPQIKLINVFNVGCGTSHKITDVAENIAQRLHKIIKIQFKETDAEHITDMMLLTSPKFQNNLAD